MNEHSFSTPYTSLLHSLCSLLHSLCSPHSLAGTSYGEKIEKRFWIYWVPVRNKVFHLLLIKSQFITSHRKPSLFIKFLPQTLLEMPSISIKGYVHPSVGPLLCWSVIGWLITETHKKNLKTQTPIFENIPFHKNARGSDIVDPSAFNDYHQRLQNGF